MSSHIHVNPWLTIWWEPQRPNVIKICTGDRMFVNDEGRKPGSVDLDQAEPAEPEQLEPACPGYRRQGAACTAADSLKGPDQNKPGPAGASPGS